MCEPGYGYGGGRMNHSRDYFYEALDSVLPVAVVVLGGKVESKGETADDAPFRRVRVLEKRAHGKAKAGKGGTNQGGGGRISTDSTRSRLRHVETGGIAWKGGPEAAGTQV
jgi:hypothetical protein